MTNFASTVPHAYNGKHNMASDAFQALRDRQATGEATNSMSFGDLIDTINPLQHIPVVSTIYRELTGDQISNQARIAGGALYGGAIGFVASMLNSAIDIATGEDVGTHVMASLFGSEPAKSEVAPEKVASAGADQTAPDASLITASIAPTPAAAPAAPVAPAMASNDVKAPVEATPATTSGPSTALPQLSPEAFNALIGSFADPEAAKKANAALAKEIASKAAATAATPSQTASATTVSPSPSLQGIAAKMETGLNQLDALKTAEAKNISLNAATSGLASQGAGSY